MPKLVRQVYTSPATGIFAPVFREESRNEVHIILETVSISQEAMRYREISQQRDVYLMLQMYCPGKQVGLPYRERMRDIPIDEMNLSVRSSNALMRSNAKTFGGVMDLLLEENGLKKVRNLGIKSEREIVRSFFSACYYRMTQREQERFWQKVIENSKNQ